MLLKYKFNNFCSFKNEAFFTMKPGKVINRFEDNVVVINPRLKVLKSAVIVGENTGGKSNFISSLKLLKLLFESDLHHRMIKNLSYNYDTKNMQSFQITVLADNNMIYTYEVELDISSILSERLYIRTSNQTEEQNKEVFKLERQKMEIVKSQEIHSKENIEVSYNVYINDKYVNSQLKNIAESITYTKGLFVNYLALIHVDIVIPFVNWVKQRLIVESPSDVSFNFYKQLRKEEEDIDIIKTPTFLEIFSLVDSSIIAIEVDEEKVFEETTIVREDSEGNTFRIELKRESSGCKEFFAWAIYIWKVLYNNAVLFADEVDKVLNPILSSRIVKLIQGSDHKGQFIFSTHNIFHLNTYDYMKEQLYIISKEKESLSSEIYSLADFKDYRYEKADVYDLYLKGILGGVPND